MLNCQGYDDQSYHKHRRSDDNDAYRHRSSREVFPIRAAILNTLKKYPDFAVFDGMGLGAARRTSDPSPWFSGASPPPLGASRP